MQKKIYTFKKGDKGIIGKAFEMEVRRALGRKNANKVLPAGMSDLKYHSKNYDTKSNGSVIKYDSHRQYVRGSNRVIYATHVAYEVISENAENIAITIDLANTQMYVLDKTEFINYLFSVNKARYNQKRNCVNIQTAYNYKKDCYHGKWAIDFERWAFENELQDDDIIGDILAGLEK